MIVVTGATGFIGTYLVDQLVKDGFDVLATGRSKAGAEYYKSKGIPFIQLDITKQESFERLPNKGVDAVVHLAAIIPEHTMPYTTGKDLLMVNALGTWNTLEYCRTNQINKIIYTTSHYEVSNVKTLPIDEEIIDYINTGNHVEYIIAKIAGDQYVKFYTAEYEIQGIILRTTCIRGYSRYSVLHQDRNIPKSNWENFIQKAYKSEPIEIWGDCTTHLRDHLYIKDAISCIVAAINNNKAVGRYNMASGKGINFEEEVKAIVKVFSPKGNPSKIIYKPEIQNAIDRSWVYDISKTKRELNWSPKYSTEEYLQDIKMEMEKDGYFK